MNDFDSAHSGGSSSDNPRQIQKSSRSSKKSVLSGLAIIGMLYLGLIGFYCVRNGGYISVQVRDFILTVSGQSSSK
jgi:hypothetical protein